MNIFEGKTAVVIGGSGGIGLEISKILAKNGASLIIHGRDDKKLKKVSDELQKQFNSTVKTVNLDLEKTDFLNIDSTLLNKFVSVADILCVCYGPFLQESVDQMTAQQWKDMSLLNYALPGFFVSSALKNMMNKKWGRILLFGGTGTSFRTEYKTNAAYAGAKTGLGILVQSVASNYADYGITCNAIMPGFVDTGYIGPQQKTELAKKMPGGKLIKEESVASAAEFLLSNGDLNGVLLRLDRGLSANLGRNNALNLT